MTEISFTYDALPGRVRFGRGLARAELSNELDALGWQRALLVLTPQERGLAEELIGADMDRVVAVFDGVRPHVPPEVADTATDLVRLHAVDGLLSVGGGSTTGTAKAVALTTGLPILAVPTTYAGSEMTPVWGLTSDGQKVTGRDLNVLPRVVLYDPDLVESLPRGLAVASALNAMAHCVEALWTTASNPVIRATALEGVRALHGGLIALTDGESDASDQLLVGAYLAGSAFAVAGSGLHHKLCHILGGAFDLPHAQTHAAILPHVLEFNVGALPARTARRLAEALACTEVSASEGLRRLYLQVGVNASLADAGLTSDQLGTAIELVSDRLPITNPRPVGPDDVKSILISAYDGIS